MMTIGSTIPENLLFFKQVEAKAVAGEPGYAQVMAEKIAELTAQKAAHNFAALQRSARAELESATDPTKATVAAAPLQAQVSNPLKPGGQRPSLMSAPLSSDMNTALLAAQEARTSNSTQPTSTTAKQAASSVPSAKEEFLEYADPGPAILQGYPECPGFDRRRVGGLATGRARQDREIDRRQDERAGRKFPRLDQTNAISKCRIPE